MQRMQSFGKESSNKLDVEQLLDMMNRAKEGDIHALYKLNRMAALCRLPPTEITFTM